MLKPLQLLRVFISSYFEELFTKARTDEKNHLVFCHRILMFPVVYFSMNRLCFTYAIHHWFQATYPKQLHTRAWNDCEFSRFLISCVVMCYPVCAPINSVCYCRWFMPLNIFVTFIVGSILAWIVNQITRPPKHLRGLVIGCCAAGMYKQKEHQSRRRCL